MNTGVCDFRIHADCLLNSPSHALERYETTKRGSVFEFPARVSLRFGIGRDDLVEHAAQRCSIHHSGGYILINMDVESKVELFCDAWETAGKISSFHVDNGVTEFHWWTH